MGVMFSTLFLKFQYFISNCLINFSFIDKVCIVSEQKTNNFYIALYKKSEGIKSDDLAGHAMG